MRFQDGRVGPATSARYAKSSLIALLIASGVLAVTHPLPAAIGQPSGETQVPFQDYLSPNNYNYTEITIQSRAIIGYATNSNVSVDTAFMTPSQAGAFAKTGDISNAVFSQEGQRNYDALLEVPGTYYLVAYSPTAAASVSGLYIVDYDISLANSTSTVAETITVQANAGTTIPLHVETLGSASRLQVLGASSQAVRYILEERGASEPVFTSDLQTITNFTVFPAVSLGYNFTLDPGEYAIAIQNPSSSPALVYFQYTIIPDYVNPFLLLFGPPSPTGITAYGIYNESGTVTTYKVATSSIVGFADIRELKAVDNGTNSPEASLQENAVLQVNNTDGATLTYWPQNVLDFDTASQTVTYRDNVLNTTGDGAQLTNESISGAGTTTLDNNDGRNQSYYGNYDSNYSYSYKLPQAWVIYMNETVIAGQGVLIHMGQRAPESSDAGNITWFDRIMIHDPGVASADFVVNGRSYTPAGAASFIGSYYDAELVFGGGPGGQAAHFTLDASLSLFYWDQTLRPFPSLYSFGDDTAEGAYNIQMSSGNGAARATSTTGQPYYGILTNDFNSSLSSLINGAIAERQPSGSGTELLIFAALIAVAVILGVVFVVRRRKTLPPAVPQTATPGEVPPLAGPAGAFCGNCGASLDPSARFCPNCGTPRHPDDISTTGTPPEGLPE